MKRWNWFLVGAGLASVGLAFGQTQPLPAPSPEAIAGLSVRQAMASGNASRRDDARVQGFVASQAVQSELAGESKTNSVRTDNGYRVELNFLEPLHVGQNEYLVQIWDANNTPVSQATVELAVEASELEEGEISTTSLSVDSDHGRLKAPAKAPSDDMAGMDGMDGMDMTDSSEVVSAETHDETANSSQSMTGESMEVVRTITAATPSNHRHNAQTETTSTIKPEIGAYAGQVSITQPGTLTVRAQVMSKTGEMTEAEFSIEIAEGNGKYAILAGFFGLNITVVGVAAVMKNNPSRRKTKRG